MTCMLVLKKVVCSKNKENIKMKSISSWNLCWENWTNTFCGDGGKHSCASALTPFQFDMNTALLHELKMKIYN